eukprot:11779518-Ditylum_brightwellii.AAC.1
MEESDDDMSVVHDSSVDDNINKNRKINPDIHCDGEKEVDEEYSFLDEIPTADASDEAFLVNEVTEYGGTLVKTVISGHVVLNQCGILLTWNKHRIKGSLKQKNMLQRMSVISRDCFDPLMYIE